MAVVCWVGSVNTCGGRLYARFCVVIIACSFVVQGVILGLFAEFWMVALHCALQLLSGVSIFSAWGWIEEFTFLTCHATSTRLFL